MQTSISRRGFLAQAAAAGVLAAGSISVLSSRAAAGAARGLKFPLIDFHVHLDNSTIGQVLELASERGVKFGVVEHAGTKENKYPVVLSKDAELERYLRMLEGKPVYKGIQAEWTDWRQCFSPAVLGRLDYVLSDAMTFPGANGQRIKLWEQGNHLGDAPDFMDRYVEWHVEVMAKEPLDILANTSWLPAAFAPQYDVLWTPARVQSVVEAALKYQVALEISSSYQLPRLPFLKIAKAAGVKFSFGSNGRYPNMGKLAYAVEMAQALGLEASDMFSPAPAGQKPFQRRQLA